MIGVALKVGLMGVDFSLIGVRGVGVVLRDFSCLWHLVCWLVCCNRVYVTPMCLVHIDI